MKYFGIPLGMWLLFERSFRKCLVTVLGHSGNDAKAITKKAKAQFREIIIRLPKFEKDDRFQMNIISCAMLCAFLQSMEQFPMVEQLTSYYKNAMMTWPMKWYCFVEGQQKFSETDSRAMKAAASLRGADRNPYSWNMEYIPYPDDSGYEARFTKCGICTLMGELGFAEFVPAMCHLDYAMAEASGTSNFFRKYTLATGGPYCDCGYQKKGKAGTG